jgi:hypothetical protein
VRTCAVYIVLPSGRKFFALCGRHLSETIQDDAELLDHSGLWRRQLGVPGGITLVTALLTYVRRYMYNRWFYASLAGICLLNVLAETLDLVQPGDNPAVDWISMLASGVAALLTGLVFLDLHVRVKR